MDLDLEQERERLAELADCCLPDNCETCNTQRKLVSTLEQLEQARDAYNAIRENVTPSHLAENMGLPFRRTIGECESIGDYIDYLVGLYLQEQEGG